MDKRTKEINRSNTRQNLRLDFQGGVYFIRSLSFPSVLSDLYGCTWLHQHLVHPYTRWSVCLCVCACDTGLPAASLWSLVGNFSPWHAPCIWWEARDGDLIICKDTHTDPDTNSHFIGPGEAEQGWKRSIFMLLFTEAVTQLLLSVKEKNVQADACKCSTHTLMFHF